MGLMPDVPVKEIQAACSCLTWDPSLEAGHVLYLGVSLRWKGSNVSEISILPSSFTPFPVPGTVMVWSAHEEQEEI